MSRWPHAYSSGPQKLSKIADGVHPLLGDYKRVPFDVQGTITGRFTRSQPEFQDPFHERPKEKAASPLVEMDFSSLEARVLAAELDRIGVRDPRTPLREEPSMRYDAPAWKPTVPGEEPPF